MAIHGIEFIQEMIQLNQQAPSMDSMYIDRYVQLVSDPLFGREFFVASPAQFGLDLEKAYVVGELATAEPYNGCKPIKNVHRIAGNIGIVRRGECMFQDKVKNLENAGAIGAIVIDNNQTTSAVTSHFFTMSGDQDRKDDVQIPAVFLYHYEGQKLLNRVLSDYRLVVRLSSELLNPSYLFEEYMLGKCCDRRPLVNVNENDFIAYNPKTQELQLHFHLPDSHLYFMSDNKFKEFAHDQLEQFKKAIYFSTRKEIDSFGRIILRFLSDLRQRQEPQVDYLMLEQLVTKMRIQPAQNEEEGAEKVLTIKCQILEKKCLLEGEERVHEERSAKTEL